MIGSRRADAKEVEEPLVPGSVSGEMGGDDSEAACATGGLELGDWNGDSSDDIVISS